MFIFGVKRPSSSCDNCCWSSICANLFSESHCLQLAVALSFHGVPVAACSSLLPPLCLPPPPHAQEAVWLRNPWKIKSDKNAIHCLLAEVVRSSCHARFGCQFLYNCLFDGHKACWMAALWCLSLHRAGSFLLCDSPLICTPHRTVGKGMFHIRKNKNKEKRAQGPN